MSAKCFIVQQVSMIFSLHVLYIYIKKTININVLSMKQHPNIPTYPGIVNISGL